MPTPIRQEKKWTHYFWEFLMLFLAVFWILLEYDKRSRRSQSSSIDITSKEFRMK